MYFSDSLDRGAHDFKQKIIHAAGVPIFPQQGVTQMIQALDHNAVSAGVRVILNFCFLIVQSSFSPSLYLLKDLWRKCASIHQL